MLCYQSMQEPGLQWPVITEDEHELSMQRSIGAAEQPEHVAGAIAEEARAQCTRRSAESALLTFVLSDTTNGGMGFHNVTPKRSTRSL